GLGRARPRGAGYARAGGAAAARADRPWVERGDRHRVWRRAHETGGIGGRRHRVLVQAVRRPDAPGRHPPCPERAGGGREAVAPARWVVIDADEETPARQANQERGEGYDEGRYRTIPSFPGG